ncbi:hypothetical protein EI171_08455 [Bradyrhizobium sp. LCT2]|uniref:hypothetical protein n=1 Tax=Bradyrhizobium sp. LCT2 TaxID=2493093 RepID=UPI0013740699|nr:hypothetical protein [Bradyrhizobium sp. LCT2]QHP67454.1 hypothetical protein EI171_08455 [Bradyrhizobium sp. LCT2]
MQLSSCVVEDSFFIAWSFLERSGELGDRDASANVLLDAIQQQLRTGERRKLMLANRAIAAYQEQVRQRCVCFVREEKPHG